MQRVKKWVEMIGLHHMQYLFPSPGTRRLREPRTPRGRKALLRSLIEATTLSKARARGKRFSANAINEHVKRPLSVFGGGALRTRAADLDGAGAYLISRRRGKQSCSLTRWMLRVFLERRSLHYLERNAIVAVLARRERTAYRERFGLRNFGETLDAMDEFTEQFEGMRATSGLCERGKENVCTDE
ncbi:hypothetical protein B0H11DRAFT_2239398 [Mycena galericulata]|nr:hypothetical protein B0H11DRAFT_2239398 [Mycena galericulata]